VREAGEDRHRRVGIEEVSVVDFRHMLGGRAESRHLHIGVNAENLTRRDLDIRDARHVLAGRCRRRSHHMS
jgi:hypothetical protein